MDVATFREDGFVGPIPVLSPAEAAAVLQRLSAAGPPPRNWSKGLAAARRVIYDVAMRPEIMGPVGEILGRNVVLWGASVVSSPPGHQHPPHVDIETSDPAARAVSVWIGLQNTTRDCGLRFVARSHRFGYPVQRAAADAGRHRGEYDESEVLEWAAVRDSEARIVAPAVQDGDALFFDGQLWHGSRNDSGQTRRALLLQFASADTPIRIPDLGSFEWPFRSYDSPRPPCLVVRGDAAGETNLIVPPPPPEGAFAYLLSDFAKSIPTPLEGDPSGWKPHFQFTAATSNLRMLSCHVSTLDATVSPHPPHAHDDEEVHIGLSGTLEVTYDDAVGRHIRRLSSGDVIHHASGWAHTLRATGPGPAEYLILKWDASNRPTPTVMESAVYSSAGLEPKGDGGFRAVTLFEGPTITLSRLHCHLSVLDPGAEYGIHHDAHDVAIVLLEGSLVKLGTKVDAPGILFTSGGYPLALHNPGSSPARYLVFEFHGRPPELVAPPSAAAAAGGEVTVVAATPQQPAAVTPSLRRARVALWNWGGRLTRRFPRVKRALRRVLGRVSPWEGPRR